VTYRHSFGDLRTGRILEEYLVDDMSWSRPLNDAGTANGTLNLEDADVRTSEPRFTCAVARSFWMIEWDEVPVWGGVVWTHQYTRKPSRRLKLGAAGLWSLFDHRKAVAALAYAQAPGEAADLGWSGISLSTQAKRLVQAALAPVGGNLPIVLPADIAGDSVRNYPAYNLSWIGDLLANLTAVEDGPDVEFTIERNPARESYVRWRMRTGNPLLEQTGDYWRFDDTVPESPVTDLSVKIDGSKMGTRAWVPGEGQERDMLLGLQEDPELVDAGYPLLEVEDTTHKTTGDPLTLDAHAWDLVSRRSRPTEQWDLTVRADAPDASLGQYAPGDAALLTVEDDGFIPDGEHAVRIIGMSSGSNRSDVTLELAPQTALV
jgi:hypothetical protein